MKLIEYVTPVTSAPEDAKLTDISYKISNIHTQYYGTFFTYKTLVDLERENYPQHIEIRLNKLLSVVNRDYRKYILNVSPDYKREGMIVLSYGGQDLVDVIGTLFSFNFNKKSYTARTKLSYQREKLINAMIIALSFLCAKYPKIYEFQVKATFLKVINDLFNYDTINRLELSEIYSSVLNLNINVIANKIKDIGLKPKEKIKKPRKQKAKTELPSKEQFENWLSSGQYTRTQLEEIIAKQYKVSAITVHRKIVEYGLARNYKYNKI